MIFGLISLVLILSLISPATSCSSPKSTGVIKLNYADFFPPTNWNSILAKQWCDEISKASNGRVEITYYPAGQLAAAAKIADAVQTGIADIGMSVVSYTMGRFPASELVEMPHNYPNGWTATKAAWDFMKKFNLTEWGNYHLLYFHAHGPQVIYTTRKPVRKLDDLSGLVIRSTGIGAKIIEALGAKGYAAGQGDAYELLSKGTIDGSFTPREPLKGWKQAEVVNYVTGTYAIGSTAGFFVAMNKAKWESLPKDIQKIFTDVSEKWVEKHGKSWTAYDKAAIDLFLSMPGKELIELNDTEMARFVAAVQPALQAYMSERAAKGLPVDEYEKYLKERVAYWAGKAPSEKECLDWANQNIVPSVPTTTAK
jgi:TRAP-type C4-dicarboxylate transport system substrate-binding protein